MEEKGNINWKKIKIIYQKDGKSFIGRENYVSK
jgi:hypothetical protein